MIKVAVSNWSSKTSVMKLLRFESHKIIYLYAFCEKGPFFNLKKSCIINGLKSEELEPALLGMNRWSGYLSESSQIHSEKSRLGFLPLRGKK